MINAYGTEYGKNYDLEKIDTHTHSWTSHPERILDYVDQQGKHHYVNYKLAENSTKIVFESENAGSFVFDKATCSYILHDGGYITGQNTPKVRDISWTVKGKEASAQNWSNLNAINNAACAVNVITENEKITVTGTKTVAGSGIFQIKLNTTASGIKETMRGYNDNPAWNNHYIGFTETIEVPQVIYFGGQQYDLSQYNNTVLGRNWIESNEAKIIKLSNKITYDFGIGFDNLNDIKIIWQGGKAKLALNYLFTDEIVPYQTWFEVDPTFGYTNAASIRQIASTNAISVSCDNSPYTKNTAYYMQKASSPSLDFCGIIIPQWDISSLPDSGVSVTGALIRTDTSSVSNGINCDVRQIKKALNVTGAPAEGLWVDARDGTTWIDNNSLCASNGSDKVLTMPSSFYPVVKNQTDVDRIAVAFVYDDVVRDASTHVIFFGATELSLNYTVTNTINLRPMHNDNSTTIGGGTVFLKNSTISTSTPINSTGWASSIVTEEINYNYTIKDSLDNFVLNKTFNKSIIGTLNKQGPTNIYRVTCGINPDIDWQIKTNFTNYHNLTYWTAPTCESNDDITWLGRFLKLGTGPLTNQTTKVVARSIDTSEYNYCPSKLLVNGTQATYNCNTGALVFNGTNIQVGNGYKSFRLSFRLITDNVTSQPTGLSGTPVSTTQINLSWTAPSQIHGSAIQSYQIWRNGTVFLNSTGSTATTYSNTGLSAGFAYLYKICAWNGIGCSPLSTEITVFTHAMTTATLPQNGTSVGDAVGITTKMRMTAGSPAATITQAKLYQNGTLLDTDTYSTSISKGQTKTLSNMYASLLNANFVYNFTVAITITNGTGGSQTFTNSTFIRPDYTATYYTLNGYTLNYTQFRTSNGSYLNLTVNRDPIPFHLRCTFKNQLFDEGTKVEGTGISYITTLQQVPRTQNVYVKCYNDILIIDFISYGQYNGTLAILDYSEELGTFFGVPVVFLFVIFLSAVFTGVKAPIGAIFLASTIGLMGVMGFFPNASGNPLITGGVWSLIVLLAVLGLFVGKRYS